MAIFLCLPFELEGGNQLMLLCIRVKGMEILTQDTEQVGAFAISKSVMESIELNHVFRIQEIPLGTEKECSF